MFYKVGLSKACITTHMPSNIRAAMIYQQQPVAVVRRAGFCTRSKRLLMKATPVGFEPTRGDPIGLAGRRLNRSAKVSLASLQP